MRSECARMVSSFVQVGSAHSLSRPLQAAVASTAPSGENAAAASGLSSPISLHCITSTKSYVGSLQARLQPVSIQRQKLADSRPFR